jgi:hypothetical protein
MIAEGDIMVMARKKEKKEKDIIDQMLSLSDFLCKWKIS